MKNRRELAQYFNKMGFKYGAEIGACFAHYSEILCQSIPGLKLLAIDNWNNDENTRRQNGRGLSGEVETRRILAPYNAIVIKKDSMEAVKDVPDESLDFVFIDADHIYSSVKEDIREWSKKVRMGGIVSGHDYYIFPYSRKKGESPEVYRGVLDAVDEYVKEHNITLLTTEWDKKNPVRDDQQPCWYFIKDKKL
jgi:hypothetical protein